MSRLGRTICSILVAFLLLSGISHPADAVDLRQSDVPFLMFTKIQFDDIDNGEFFSIFNPGHERFDISDWSISDGEGELLLAQGSSIPPNSELIVARSYSSYLRQNGEAPDCTILEGFGGTARVLPSGTFRLSNDGDELILKNPDKSIVDCVAFGDRSDIHSLGDHWHGVSVPSPGRGCILTRQRNESGYLETDSKEDWIALREYRPGQSSLPPLERTATVTALILPEHSNVILESLLGAKACIKVCTYEYNSKVITIVFERLMREGVRIEIILEGSPVGGMKDDSIRLLDELSSRGAKIFVMKAPASNDAIRRYPYLHSKYIVIDDRVSVILSENLVAEVFDSEPGRGNRGSGVILDSKDVASYLDTLFRTDTHSGFSDTFPWSSSGYNPSNLADVIADCPLPVRVVPMPPTSTCHIKLFPFPDFSDAVSGIEKLLSSMEQSLSVELFYADLNWKTSMKGVIVNPILSAIAGKIRLMDEFIFCLDGSWISKTNGGNSEVIHAISNDWCSYPSGSFVGFQNASAPFSIIHNKGFVIDHRLSVVSSINWCFQSACSNRELAVLIDDGRIASYFEDNIRRDIYGDSNPPRIEPRFSFSKKGDAISLTIAPESDESGLKSAIIIKDGKKVFNWTMEIDPEHPPEYVDIRAVDLWGNRAELRIVLFPDSGDFVVGSSDIGMLASCISVAGISYAIISSLRFWLRMRRAETRIRTNIWNKLE